MTRTPPTRRRFRLALAAAALAALAVPGSASAHAVPGIDYRFPLPVWLFALAAGIAVLGSAAAAAFATARPEAGTARGNLYPWVRRLRLGAAGLALASVLLVIALAGGLFGAQEFFENPATILIWVDFWVGLGIVSALVGNVWDFMSPLSAAGRFLERRFSALGLTVLPYPSWLGLRPATILVLVWSWMELVWDPAREPRTLAAIAIAYVLLQLVAMAAFGTETWLARGELFTAVARSFARFAPLELYVVEPAAPCRAGRCVEEERIGCADCWLDAPPEGRGLRLRPTGPACGVSPHSGRAAARSFSLSSRPSSTTASRRRRGTQTWRPSSSDTRPGSPRTATFSRPSSWRGSPSASPSPSSP